MGEGVFIWGWDSDAKKNVPVKVSSTGKVYIVAVVDTLDDIGDVNAPSPDDGEALVWDDGTSKWVPAAPAPAAHAIGGALHSASTWANVKTKISDIANVTAVELERINGLTSAIQTQLDARIFKSLLTTRGDMIRRSATVPERFALGTAGQKLTARTDAVWEDDIAVINFIIDGGGSVITTGEKGHLEIPFACTILQVTTLADQSGSIVVDIWKRDYANFPPADAQSITASAPPTISGAVKAQDSTLTGWTKTIAAGDILAYNVDSIATCERVTISLKVKKT